MDKEYLKEAAKAVGDKLPDNYGFVIFAFPFNTSGRIVYISNAQREDTIKALKEWLFAQGEKENWMKHIK